MHLILILLIYANFLQAQETQVKIRFNPTFNGEAIALNKNYYLESAKDSVLFENLKFYICDIQFFKNKKLVAKVEEKYHLIDLENPHSQDVFYSNKKKIAFNTIQFHLGIDSVTNVSGALGGDLDPTKGMYWTWQSGYINFKLEGKSKICPARKNIFQFHIGGYLKPFDSLQKINLPILFNQKEIFINIEIAALLNKINLKETYQIMSPNEKAMEIAGILSTIFKIAK